MVVLFVLLDIGRPHARVVAAGPGALVPLAVLVNGLMRV